MTYVHEYKTKTGTLRLGTRWQSLDMAELRSVRLPTLGTRLARFRTSLRIANSL